MTKTSSTLDEFAQMGIAALLPGMTYLLELMTKAVEEKRNLLHALQEGIEQIATAPRRGRPPGAKNKAAPSGKINGWPADPEERRAEMKRRMALWKTKRASKKAKVGKTDLAMSPAHKDHPDHAQFVAKLRKTTKRAWASKTPEQRQAWRDAIDAGKAKAKRAREKTVRQARAAGLPVVELERTA